MVFSITIPKLLASLRITAFKNPLHLEIQVALGLYRSQLFSPDLISKREC